MFGMWVLSGAVQKQIVLRQKSGERRNSRSIPLSTYIGSFREIFTEHSWRAEDASSRASFYTIVRLLIYVSLEQWVAVVRSLGRATKVEGLPHSSF